MSSVAKPSSEIRWWDTLSALLLICAVLISVGRLVATDWTEGLGLVQFLTLLAVLLGLVIGQSRFSPRASFFIASGYSLFFISWQLGMLIQGEVLWKERLMMLGRRLVTTIDLALRLKPVNDNVLFVLLMSVLFWILSIYAGYSLTRYGAAWRSLLPLGLAIVVIQSYDPHVPRRAWFLASFLLFALLLIARTTYVQQSAGWRSNRTYVPPDIGFDWIRFTVIASILLIVMAWTAPALAETLPPAAEIWQTVRRPWSEFQDKMSSTFSSLKASVGFVTDYYGNSLALGRGSTLSNTPFFSVKAPAREIPGTRYYWRAYTYDFYEDNSWQNTITQTREFDPDSEVQLFPDDIEGRWVTSFTFTPDEPLVTLFAPSQPIWIDTPASATLVENLDGSIDLVALEAQPFFQAGESYTVRASLTAATQAQLRAAGNEYPEWIAEKYLQLPDSITPRTLELARQISEGEDNPYDIAVAITQYLREYEYVETIDPPPANQDVIDWWLFDYRKGFCNYYATSEVIMLRSLGIPARLAVGYAEGEFIADDMVSPGLGEDVLADPENFLRRGGTYQVRQRDSHAWPEVYFPGLGWVEFEPTQAQTPIIRPSGEQVDRQVEPPELNNFRRFNLEDMLEPGDEAFDASPEEPVVEQRENTYWLLALLASLIAFIVYAWRRGMIVFDFKPIPVHLERGMRRIGLNPPSLLKRWAEYARLSPLVHAYLEINRALRRLGQPPKGSDTPAERAQSLSLLLPETSTYLDRLLNAYQFSEYSLTAADEQVAREAGREVRKQSYLVWLRALLTGKRDSPNVNHHTEEHLKRQF